MEFDEFQRRAAGTDQNPALAVLPGVGENPDPGRAEVIPLLGMVGEVGSLLGEYKKLLRDGETHRRFKDEVREELGDILWYVATVASKYGLSLDDVAKQNIDKVEGRWTAPASRSQLYDDNQEEPARLPREFSYAFEHREVDGVQHLHLIDVLDDKRRPVGDPLRDNTYDDDGYRYHDVFHLTLAARFGWSPVYRKLLRDCEHIELDHRTPNEIDDAEDGGRAQVLDEAIALTAYGYAAEHNLFENSTAVDWQLLRSIKRMTANVEVRDRTTKEWNDAILCAFQIWRQLKAHKGGIVSGDLRRGEIEFTPPD